MRIAWQSTMHTEGREQVTDQTSLYYRATLMESKFSVNLVVFCAFTAARIFWMQVFQFLVLRIEEFNSGWLPQCQSKIWSSVHRGCRPSPEERKREQRNVVQFVCKTVCLALNSWLWLQDSLCFLSFHRDLKVVILGSASVGKTTLIHRYIDGRFQETISVSACWTQGTRTSTVHVVVFSSQRCARQRKEKSRWVKIGKIKHLSRISILLSFWFQTIGASFSLKQWGPYNIALWVCAKHSYFKLWTCRFYQSDEEKKGGCPNSECLPGKVFPLMILNQWTAVIPFAGYGRRGEVRRTEFVL